MIEIVHSIELSPADVRIDISDNDGINFENIQNLIKDFVAIRFFLSI